MFKFLTLPVLFAALFSCRFLSPDSNGLDALDMCNSEMQRSVYKKKGSGKRIYRLQPPPRIQPGQQYPLIIGLHGWTEDKDAYMELPDTGSAFYLAPGNAAQGWAEGARWVRSLIGEMVAKYPIDTRRIYIIGFSMGGSGSFPFAERLYEEQELVAAAIVRCAGMSRPVLKGEAFENTALWYNLGDRDDLEGVSDIFHKSRDYYSPRGKKADQYRFTLREGMGHEYLPVFSDGKVMEWLFSRTLEL